MSCIYYKFKSEDESKTLVIDGLHISVGELKQRIYESKRMGKSADSDLQITNAQTKEVYPEDTCLIPRNSSVIVARIPAAARQRLPKVRDTSSDGVVRRSPKDPFASADRSPRSVDRGALGNLAENTSLTEDEKLSAVLAQSAHGYQVTDYKQVPRGKSLMVGVPPPTYSCRRCHLSGHWINQCPLLNMPVKKQVRGVPREDLVSTTMDDPHAMLTPFGQVVANKLHLQAYKIGKKERPPFLFEGEGTSASSVGAGGGSPAQQAAAALADEAAAVPPPRELLCPLCGHLFTDAVLIPCCGNSFCDECIRGKLTKNLEQGEPPRCPACRAEDVLPDSLLPNSQCRMAVVNFKNKSGYAHHAGAAARMKQQANEQDRLTETQLQHLRVNLSRPPAHVDAASPRKLERSPSPDDVMIIDQRKTAAAEPQLQQLTTYVIMPPTSSASVESGFAPAGSASTSPGEPTTGLPQGVAAVPVTTTSGRALVVGLPPMGQPPPMAMVPPMPPPPPMMGGPPPMGMFVGMPPPQQQPPPPGIGGGMIAPPPMPSMMQPPPPLGYSMRPTGVVAPVVVAPSTAPMSEEEFYRERQRLLRERRREIDVLAEFEKFEEGRRATQPVKEREKRRRRSSSYEETETSEEETSETDGSEEEETRRRERRKEPKGRRAGERRRSSTSERESEYRRQQAASTRGAWPPFRPRRRRRSNAGRRGSRREERFGRRSSRSRSPFARKERRQPSDEARRRQPRESSEASQPTKRQRSASPRPRTMKEEKEEPSTSKRETEREQPPSPSAVVVQDEKTEDAQPMEKRRTESMQSDAAADEAEGKARKKKKKEKRRKERKSKDGHRHRHRHRDDEEREEKRQRRRGESEQGAEEEQSPVLEDKKARKRRRHSKEDVGEKVGGDGEPKNARSQGKETGEKKRKEATSKV